MIEPADQYIRQVQPPELWERYQALLAEKKAVDVEIKALEDVEKRRLDSIFPQDDATPEDPTTAVPKLKPDGIVGPKTERAFADIARRTGDDDRVADDLGRGFGFRDPAEADDRGDVSASFGGFAA